MRKCYVQQTIKAATRENTGSATVFDDQKVGVGPGRPRQQEGVRYLGQDLIVREWFFGVSVNSVDDVAHEAASRHLPHACSRQPPPYPLYCKHNKTPKTIC